MDISSYVRPASLIFIFGGALVMLGWITGLSLLTTPIPGGPSMKFPTAFAILLGGFAIRGFHQIINGQKQGDSMTRVMGASVLLFVIFFPLLGSYFWNIPLGLEVLFEPPRESASLNLTIVPSIGTIICIGILFFISFLAGVGYSISKLSRYGGAVLVGISALALAGYLLNNPQMYFLSGRSTGMALHTVAAFLGIGICLLLIGFRHHVDHQPTRESVPDATA